MTYAVQVVLKTVDNIPANYVTNVWHFESVLGPGSDFDNVRDMLKDFYGTKAPDAQAPLYQYLSPSLSGDALVKFYDLSQPKPRVPAAELPMNIGTPSGTPLPSEVALVASFQAEAISGQKQSRRRNRIYLGPLNTNTLDNGRPKQQFISSVVRAMSQLYSAQAASLTWRWRVYSPTSGQTLFVHDGWVDNAFDTQRRRGVAPTSRTTFTDTITP